MGVIKLKNNIQVDYLVGAGSKITSDQINLLNNQSFIPNWDFLDSTEIVCSFDEDINSSYIKGLSSPLTGFAIYRQKIGESSMHKVAEVSSNVLDVIDHLISNNQNYKWIVLPLTSNESGTSIMSDEFYTNWESWTITSLDEIADNTYKVNETWRFSLNLSDSDIKQNRSKIYLSGYSKYPKALVGEQNYITSSITCLLGNLNPTTDEYVEDIDKVRAWSDFCASGKPCLLKDVKGNMFVVQIDGDNTFKRYTTSKELPTEISFSFTEITSVNDITVYDTIDTVVG